MRPMATIEREALVTLTESAATKVKALMAEEPEGEATVLRVAVQGGGCSGFEYALGFDSGAQEGDHELDAFMHLWAINRGILLTPFHNMALMSPFHVDADVHLHTEVFGAAVDALVG